MEVGGPGVVDMQVDATRGRTGANAGLDAELAVGAGQGFGIDER